MNKLTIALLALATSPLLAAELACDWSESVSQQWIGRHFWQNSYRDWAQQNGRIEIVKPGGGRCAVVTTHSIDASKPFTLRTRMGVLASSHADGNGWGGFKLALRGGSLHLDHWKTQIINSHGTPAGLTATGQLFIDQVSVDAPTLKNLKDVRLTLEAVPEGTGVRLTLSATSGDQTVTLNRIVGFEHVTGPFALSSHNGEIGEKQRFAESKTNGSGTLAHWFDQLSAAGPAIIATPERQFGPIAFVHYLLASGTLRMNAQLPPLDMTYTTSITLEVQPEGGADWQLIATASYSEPSSTALFTVPHWPHKSDIPYRVTWAGIGFDGKPHTEHFGGIIQGEPTGKDVVLGSFNCMFPTGFPYVDSISRMEKIRPHILAFTGDQLYEGAGGYGCIFGPYEDARLNYFQHWFLHGMAFRDLLANSHSITINDDHDVFHGNIWGEAGKAADMTLQGAAAQQDSGGYKMGAPFVNLVQQGQCGHLAPSPSTAPVKQGIAPYYTDVRFAGISFAVLEDRKWKSAPQRVHADTEVYNGYFKDPNYAADTLHIRDMSKKADLLGERQEQFLESWAADWSDHTWMKVVVSQTAFTNAATDGLGNKEPWDRYADANFPLPGRWPTPAAAPSHDMDANGWPSVARDRAVHLMRKAFAPHITGDQHLGSMIRYGIESHDTASVAFCVPAATTGWSRLWMPEKPGDLDDNFLGHLDGADFIFDPKRYCGKFVDGQGNKFTMLAVANPYQQDRRQPAWYYDRQPGYGVVTFHRKSHDITMTAWPAWAGPDGEGDEGKPYPGWPLRIRQADNYDRPAAGYLPEVQLDDHPVVQVINDSTGEIEYTLRPAGQTFRPRVFDPEATYTLRTGDPDTNSWSLQPRLTPRHLHRFVR